MKYRSFHRWMTRWAFAATLALVLVPTIGRLAGQAAMPMHHPTAAGSMVHVTPAQAPAGATDHGMIEAHGNALADTSSHSGLHASAAVDAQVPSGNGHHDPDEDCAYCPLLLGTIALPVPMLLAGLPLRSPAMSMPVIRSAVLERHPTGLGSRGPPLLG